jgi:flagellar biosynthesis protein FlhB
LVISSIVLADLLSITFLSLIPDFQTINISDSVSKILGSGIIYEGIKYLLNIIIIFILAKDMKNLNLKSNLILIMTFFSSIVGILFFLLTIANIKLNSKNINTHE